MTSVTNVCMFCGARLGIRNTKYPEIKENKVSVAMFDSMLKVLRPSTQILDDRYVRDLAYYEYMTGNIVLIA